MCERQSTYAYAKMPLVVFIHLMKETCRPNLALNSSGRVNPGRLLLYVPIGPRRVGSGIVEARRLRRGGRG